MARSRSCLPWLEAELARVKPRVLATLGATASVALLGRAFRVSQDRGRMLERAELAPRVLATVHPASVVRLRGRDGYDDALRGFVADLCVAVAAL